MKDPKTRLQEILQGNNQELPVYEVESVTGQDHDLSFKVKCSLPSLNIAQFGEGASRRLSEKIAAQRIIEELEALGLGDFLNTSDFEQTKSGYVALFGRPNVGKSTLLNYLLRQKISITSRKPQTTRVNLLGIDTRESHQAIYVDTPGIIKKTRNTLNRFMVDNAKSLLGDVDWQCC